jgi:hypothetical protein
VAVSKTSGTRYYIGPVVDTDAIQALTDEDAVTYFEGLSWTEVEEIESFGSFGDTAATASFASVKDRRMRKYKTTRDGGTMAIVCGRDPLDAGQIALAAAERSDFNYAFKVVFADHRDADHTDSIEYFGGMVISRPTNLGGVGDITKQDFNVEVNTAIYAVPSDSSVVPVNLVLPSIIGTQVRVGYTLTAVEGEWTGEPTSYTYQWQHDVSGNGTFGNVSVGGTGRTYVPVVGDILDSLRVQVIAVNGAGNSTAANSLGTIPIIAA